MNNSSPFRYLLKFIAIWCFTTFSILWFIVYKFTWGKRLVEQIITQTGLNQDFKSLKNGILSIKNWAIGVLKVIMNHFAKTKYPFGYAILNKNGMYITTQSQFPYVIQLYDYLSRKFMKIRNLSSYRVMQIEPTTQGGLQYIATALKATSCLGVNTDQKSYLSLKKSNLNPRMKFIHSPKLQSLEIKENNFDCIIGINIFQKSLIVDETLKLIKKSLKQTGYACIAQYLPVQQISVFQYCLKQAGLKIVKSQNLSNSLSNAIKIQAKQQREQTLFRKFKKVLNYFLQYDNIYIDVLAELQMRRKFIGYVVQHENN